MEDLFNSTVVLAPPTATLLLSFVLPLLVAAGTKLVAPAWVKSFINLLLAVALGLITILSQAGVEGVPMKRLLAYSVVAIIGSNLAYNQVWKPLGVWPLIQQWTAGTGFGGGSSEQPLNPNQVLTPPPGGVGESPSAHFSDITYTMETGVGFQGVGSLTEQVVVSEDDAGLAPARIQGTEATTVRKAPWWLKDRSNLSRDDRPDLPDPFGPKNPAWLRMDGSEHPG